MREEDVTAALMRAGARVAVVVLDACRDNPLGAGTRGVGGERGLAPHDPPSGVFTFYSASRGQAALDRLSADDPNPNSVFTRVLVPALTRGGGVDLPALAVGVREEVARIAASAGHPQRPAYYDETVGGPVYLAGMPQGDGQPRPTSGAAQAWGAIQNTTSPAVLDDYIRQYGDVPTYGLLARTKRQALTKALEPLPQTPTEPGVTPLTAAQERGLKPGDTFRECGNCPEMVVVPAGSFTMGSPSGQKDRDDDEGPQHVVTIGKPFAVGKVHVTVDQYKAFIEATGYQASSKCWTFEGGKAEERAGRSWRNPGFVQDGSHPVVCVNFDGATAYVDWLARRTTKPYRLLSEAEWEYAARGRTRPGAYPRFWYGDDEKDLCRYGNGFDQSARDIIVGTSGWTFAPCNDGHAYTSPAGNYLPNAFGLYDMAGNAWQWTADCYHSSYAGAPADGAVFAARDCNRGRVIRGGSWGNIPKEIRAAYRSGETVTGNRIGFRLARTLAFDRL